MITEKCYEREEVEGFCGRTTISEKQEKEIVHKEYISYNCF